MPKVSVALTTYNGEKYISQQLDSILNQTVKVDEVIIVDDVSKDHTSAIVSQYLSNHQLNWHFEVNPNNLGFIQNFQKALKLTTGDYIFLCDQDDLWVEDRVEKMVSILEEHTEIDLVSCNISLIDEKNEPLSIDHAPYWYSFMNQDFKEKLTPFDFFELCKQNYSPGCTMLLRRKLLMKYLEIAPDYTIAHDWLMNILASTTQSSYFYNERLVQYRIHSENTIGLKEVSNQRNVEQLKNEYILLKKRYNLGINTNVSQTNLSHNIAYLNTKIAYYSKKNLPNLFRVIHTSHHTYHMWNSMLKDNIKDILILLR